jgi:hypothetical protein
MNDMSRLHSDLIQPKQVRYIKLGQNNAWAEASFADGRIAFGHDGVPHDLAVAGDWDGVRKSWGADVTKGKATDYMREVKDFYTQGSDCLWITFAQGRMWWAFAETEVVLSNGRSEAVGSRHRRVLGSWQSCGRFGKALILSQISSKLTKTGAYRQTICKVEAQTYAVRLINGVEDPAILEAKAARAAFIDTLLPIVQSLHETDFELLTDLLFSRLGWVRVSGIGGTQKDTDLILEQPATKARALVQVKSAANQTVLDDYVSRFAEMDTETSFFVCHSPRGTLKTDGSMHIWSGADLASRIVQAGLVDWVLERAA